MSILRRFLQLGRFPVNICNYRMQSSSTSPVAEAPLLQSKIGAVEVVSINRPKALNSLNTEICKLMLSNLTRWGTSDKENIGCFILKGVGGKAFCAGGDVKAITQSEAKVADEFFRTEYRMNYGLSASPIPQISIWDGVVMGGGVGISIFGKFRIATEKTLFAMPETAIGLFPDVGSSFWLSKLPSGFGEYLGLTGCRLRYDTLLRLGIATHFVPSDKIVELEDEIVRSVSPGDPQSTAQLIGSILRKYQGKLPPAPTESPEELFKGKMDAGELYRDVMSQLDVSIPWQAEIQKSLRAASPTALHLTFEQIKAARENNFSVQDCLKMEYRMVQKCLSENDFREGVRALLIEKDNKPKWRPARIEDVRAADIDDYFKNIGDRELTF